MMPVSPVIPNADAPEIVIAENQPEYQNLPSIPLEGGIILCRWKMTEEEKRIVSETGDVYLYQWTGGKFVTPMLLQVEVPVIQGVEEFSDDILESELLDTEIIETRPSLAKEKQKYRIRCSFDAEKYRDGMEDGFEEGNPWIETYKGKVFVNSDIWIVTNPQGEKDIYSSVDFYQIYSPENS